MCPSCSLLLSYLLGSSATILTLRPGLIQAFSILQNNAQFTVGLCDFLSFLHDGPQVKSLHESISNLIFVSAWSWIKHVSWFITQSIEMSWFCSLSLF